MNVGGVRMKSIIKGGTVGLTCAIFLAAYGGYFLVTYLMSTGMVRAAIATRYSE